MTGLVGSWRPTLGDIPLRLWWQHPSIAVTAGSTPEWALFVENTDSENRHWSGFPLLALGSLRTPSGDVITGTGHRFAIPAMAVPHTLEPGEIQPVQLVLERVTDDDLSGLDVGIYQLQIDQCFIPPPVRLPGTLEVTVSASGR
jgi:hypothetical protein